METVAHQNEEYNQDAHSVSVLLFSHDPPIHKTLVRHGQRGFAEECFIHVQSRAGYPEHPGPTFVIDGYPSIRARGSTDEASSCGVAPAWNISRFDRCSE